MWLRSGMIREVNGRWGLAKYFAKDEYVGKSVHYYGEYNPDETEKILELAHGLCLDIGANIGCISQALVASGHRVEAFEPQPEVYKLLCVNVSANTHCVALGSEPGEVEMPKVHYSERGNFGGLSCGTKSIYGSYLVPVKTLDSFKFTDVGFIKLDVEGFEREVLVGGRETIMRDKPVLYIEDDRVERRKALREMIVELGYKFTEHQPTLYREQNFFGLQRNVWDQNYASHNLICTPC